MSERKKTKATAWKYFSKYIRLKECLETTGSFEYGKCCDCGKVQPFNYLDAGHCVPGRNDLILFLEENVHIQCRSCNRSSKTKTRPHDGISPGYYLYMVNKYGEKKVTELVRKKFMTGNMHISDFEDIKKKYKEKLKEIKGLDE